MHLLGQWNFRSHLRPPRPLSNSTWMLSNSMNWRIVLAARWSRSVWSILWDRQYTASWIWAERGRGRRVGCISGSACPRRHRQARVFHQLNREIWLWAASGSGPRRPSCCWWWKIENFIISSNWFVIVGWLVGREVVPTGNGQNEWMDRLVGRMVGWMESKQTVGPNWCTRGRRKKGTDRRECISPGAKAKASNTNTDNKTGDDNDDDNTSTWTLFTLALTHSLSSTDYQSISDTVSVASPEWLGQEDK